MRLSEYAAHDATGLAELVRRGETTPAELAELALAAVEKVNPQLNAVIEVFPEVTGKLRSEPPPPGLLAGVPILNKDLIADAGRRLEMGSELARGLAAPFTDALLARLKSAGVTVLGRTTTPEFGMATVTESRIAGVTRNPWDLDRTPGGSSGGSAAMVAARAVPLATASDAGGSIRSPAAHCGIVGLKPSRGRMSQMPVRGDPLMGLSVNFVLTRSVRDSALALDLCHGREAGDPYGIEAPPGTFAASLARPPKPLRVAVAASPWPGDDVDASMLEGLEKTWQVFERHSHVVEAARPEFDHQGFADAVLKIWCANIVNSVDALAESCGRKPGNSNLQSSVLAYYRRGQRLTVKELLHAIAVIDNVNRSIGQFFLDYDLLLTPTCLRPAPLIGELDCDPDGDVDVACWDRRMNRIDGFLAAFNASGNPAMSLPVHTTDAGLPVGVQAVAPFAGEVLLLQAAALIEQELPWKDRYPACSAF